MDGLSIGTMPYVLQHGTNVVIDIDQGSTVYLAIHSTSNSNNLTNWLQRHEWSEIVDQEILYHGENGSEALNSIWFKEVLAVQELNITFMPEPLTVAAFFKPGKDNFKYWFQSGI